METKILIQALSKTQQGINETNKTENHDFPFPTYVLFAQIGLCKLIWERKPYFSFCGLFLKFPPSLSLSVPDAMPTHNF